MASSNPNFTCNLDGYNNMAQEAFNAVLTPVNLIVNLMPTLIGYVGNLVGTNAVAYLQKSFEMFYQYFTLTLPGSMGYMIGTLFYVLKYLGYAQYMCQASGYVYYVIYYANYLNVLLQQLSNASGATN